MPEETSTLRQGDEMMDRPVETSPRLWARVAGAFTMPGAWVFYIFLGSVDVVLTALIVWYAWT
jgi:hypothetical protein